MTEEKEKLYKKKEAEKLKSELMVAVTEPPIITENQEPIEEGPEEQKIEQIDENVEQERSRAHTEEHQLQNNLLTPHQENSAPLMISTGQNESPSDFMELGRKPSSLNTHRSPYFSKESTYHQMRKTESKMNKFD